MRALLLVALVPVAAFAAAEAHEDVGSNAVLSPDGRLALSTEEGAYAWPEHPFLERVCFTVTNVDDEPVTWPVSIPFYWITGPAGVHYMGHGHFDGAEWTVEAGASYTDCWGVRRDPGVRTNEPLCAEPGRYTVHFEHVDRNEGWMVLQLPFDLVAPADVPPVTFCPIGDL